MKYIMKCMKCATAYTDDEATLTCLKCGSPLNVNIAHGMVGKITPKFFKQGITSMWKYLPFLPLKDEANIVSLGEGATPLLRSNNLSEATGIDEILLKNETLNPTGSFLDRQISNGVSIAKELGYKRVVSLSTGNQGASVAAYCARAGIKSLIIVPETFRRLKTYQIRFHGGNVIQVESNSHKELMDIVLKAASHFNAINLASTSLYNAFTNHGAKTIIYELFEQMDLTLPKLIVVPVGGAGLLSSLIQACMELKELQFIKEIPRFLAVQPEGCQPFIKALQQDLRPDDVYESPWPDKETVISALAYEIPFDYTWFYFLKQQLEPGTIMGMAIPDHEAMKAQKTLSEEGLFVEIASAITVAAIKKLKESGLMDKQDWNPCCAILTGTGLLDIKKAMETLDPPKAYPLNSDWQEVVGSFFSD